MHPILLSTSVFMLFYVYGNVSYMNIKKMDIIVHLAIANDLSNYAILVYQNVHSLSYFLLHHKNLSLLLNIYIFKFILLK